MIFDDELAAEYPEHAKLNRINEQSQVIGEFIEMSGYSLCVFDDESGHYVTVHKSVQRILAEYFDINLDALNREKDAMLASLRRMQ